MQTVKFMYWKDEEMFIGHFLDYPDDWTQSTSLDDLKKHRRDLYTDMTCLGLG